MNNDLLHFARYAARGQKMHTDKDSIVMIKTVVRPTDMDMLRSNLSDEELEIAAEETALSYTYQTSAYNRCCQ